MGQAARRGEVRAWVRQVRCRKWSLLQCWKVGAREGRRPSWNSMIFGPRACSHMQLYSSSPLGRLGRLYVDAHFKVHNAHSPLSPGVY
jgi:hypothetical protein